MFEKILILIFKVFIYRGYRSKYMLPEDFKFNGYFIRISGDGKVFAGDRCYISYFTYLNVEKNFSITLGDRVSIGHNVKIYTTGFSTRKFVIDKIEEKIAANVKIGSNVLIGSNSFVCPGVVICDDVVVGANSVVSCSLLRPGVYAGSPARLIKDYSGE